MKNLKVHVLWNCDTPTTLLPQANTNVNNWDGRAVRRGEILMSFLNFSCCFPTASLFYYRKNLSDGFMLLLCEIIDESRWKNKLIFFRWIQTFRRRWVTKGFFGYWYSTLMLMDVGYSLMDLCERKSLQYLSDTSLHKTTLKCLQFPSKKSSS